MVFTLINPVRKLVNVKFPNGDITQWFGENPTLYSRFNLAGHNGIDIVRPYSEVMFAVEDGIVVDAKDTPDGFGIHVRFISDQKNVRGYQHEWTYGHCSKLLVKQGDRVHAGQAIALMGNTGFVVKGHTPFWSFNPYAGTHLHLGLREVRVRKSGGWSYEGSDLKLSVVNSNNGYRGAIDPLPYLLLYGEDQIEIDFWRQLALTTISLSRKVISLLNVKIT